MNQLEIGIGNRPRRKGWVTADLTPGNNVDLVFDASQPEWPVRPSSFGLIEAIHVLEHLSDFWGFFQGAWTALVDGGVMQLRMPYGASEDALADPTHLRVLYPGSFCALQPGYGEAVFNPQHKWDYPFEISYALIRIRPEFRWLCRPFIRKIGIRLLPYIWNSCVEFLIGLRKVPRGSTLAKPGNAVNVGYCMYAKEYYRRDAEGERLMVFRC